MTNTTLADPTEGDAGTDPLRLAQLVARWKVEAAVKDNPSERVLFSIVGLSPEQTSAIAREIDTEVDGAEVHIHPDLSDGGLSERLLSEKPSTYWRNARRANGAGAVVFAVPDEERETSGASIANVVTIDTTTMLDDVDAWLEASGRTLGVPERARLRDALDGLAQTDLILSLEVFARFVARVVDAVGGTPVEYALDAALPELRLPKHAGRFRSPTRGGAGQTPRKWAKEFVRVERETRDKLYLRTDRGAPLERGKLRKNLDDLEGDGKLSADAAAAVRALLDDDEIAPGRWTQSQADVVETSWSEIEKVFAESRTRQQQEALGKATRDFFEHWHPDALDQDDREILDGLSGNKSESDPEEANFFFAHRELLRGDRKLYNRWERFIFQKPVERDNLFSGLLLGLQKALQAAAQSDGPEPTEPVAYVALAGATAPAYWTDRRNTALCRHLRDAYRGLPELMRPRVVIDFGRCWDPDLHAKIDEAEVTSATNDATEFKFEVYLLDQSDFDANNQVAKSTLRNAPKGQFKWTLPANSVPAQLSNDLRELVPNSVGPARALTSRLSRNPKADRGQDTRITLEDCHSLLDATGKSEGALAVSDAPELDAVRALREGLAEFEEERAVGAEAAREVRARIDAFVEAFGRAIRALTAADGKGLADPALIEQGVRYGELLTSLRQRVRAEAARWRLWRPALNIGVAQSTERPPAAIVAAWQPLRLAETAAKARRLADLCAQLLDGDVDDVAACRNFFDDRARALEQYDYPGVCGHFEDSGAVLAGQSHLGGYTMMEPQTADQGAAALFEADPKTAANQFLKICEDYLELKPHEQANFSCVLYNAESRGLPTALSERLARKIDGEPRLRCDLTLTHDNSAKLRSIYAEQNAQIGREIDSALSSEAARSFLSRLRVGFNDLPRVRKGDGLGHNADLVLMQDVLARNATTRWRPVSDVRAAPGFVDIDPFAQSRRCPRDPKRRSTATHLTAPLLPVACQAYVDLLHDLVTHDETGGDHSWLPVREIRFDDEAVTNALQSSHDIGEWVVNYDAIADRQLFEQNSNRIKIIRHLSGPGDHHNVIVSSKEPGRQLRHRLDLETRRLVPELDANAREGLVDTLLEEASRLSGQVVMRAARFERNALELIGLALSKPLIRDTLGHSEPRLAWFFLDDVAAWFGHASGKTADILALAPKIEDGVSRIDLLIAESKFVAEEGSSAQMRKSDAQLQETVEGFRNRFFGDESQIDAAMWRGRLADMMIEYLRTFDEDDPESLMRWAEALRAGEVEMRLVGRSYGFVHDMPPPAEVERSEPRSGEVQLVLPRDETAALLRRMAGVAPNDYRTPEERAPTSYAEATSAASEQRQEPETSSSGQGKAMQQARADADDGEGDPIPERNDHLDEAKVDAQEGGKFAPANLRAALPRPVAKVVEAHATSLSDDTDQDWLKEATERLRVALRNWNMDCKVNSSDLTPNAGLIRFQGSDKLTPAMIRKREEELMTSHGLQVLDVIPAPREVVVMIARPNRSFPTIHQVWARKSLPESAPDLNTSLTLGLREDTGEPLYLNLVGSFAGQAEHQPHTLIAGMTGGGKGVLVQNLLLDICATNSPDSARIWLFDPKRGLDYRWLEKMPHLEGGLVRDQDEAADALNALVAEMNRRNELFFQLDGVQKLADYNAAVAPEHRLPRIYLFHDEFAIWGQQKEYKELAEKNINSLGQMARAAGIHVFLITQRPDKDVMPLQARDNLGNRLALQVANDNNAQLIGLPGADRLLPHGHLAAKLPGDRQQVVYVQVPNVRPEDLEALGAAICEAWGEAK